MKPITLASAIASIERAVAEKGADYVYQRINVTNVDGPVCAFYDENGNCSCLVGYVLYDHGYTYDMVINQNLENIYAVSIYRRNRNLPFEITDAALQMLGQLPSKQDNGETWGDCLEFARSYL